MAHKIIAKVKFKYGLDPVVLKHRTTAKLPLIEKAVSNLREVIQTSYQQNIPAQMTIGTTSINILDTMSIDIKIKWCF